MALTSFAWDDWGDNSQSIGWSWFGVIFITSDISHTITKLSIVAICMYVYLECTELLLLHIFILQVWFIVKFQSVQLSAILLKNSYVPKILQLHAYKYIYICMYLKQLRTITL